jgi:hypothetical protein
VPVHGEIIVLFVRTLNVRVIAEKDKTTKFDFGIFLHTIVVLIVSVHGEIIVSFIHILDVQFLEQVIGIGINGNTSRSNWG